MYSGMTINLPIAIGNNIFQLQAKKEFTRFGFSVPEFFADTVVYRIYVPVSLNISKNLTESISRQHAPFLTQMAKNKKWEIKYNIIIEEN